MYFGFCHCPDICPETMEKVMDIIDIHKAEQKTNPELPDIQPVFITIGTQLELQLDLDAEISNCFNVFAVRKLNRCFPYPFLDAQIGRIPT